jgi:hypothetical protein
MGRQKDFADVERKGQEKSDDQDFFGVSPEPRQVFFLVFHETILA